MYRPNAIYAHFDRALQPLRMNDRTNIYHCIFDPPIILAGEIFNDIVIADDPEDAKKITRREFRKLLSDGPEVKQVRCVGEGICYLDEPDDDGYQRLMVRVTTTDDPALIPLNKVILLLDIQHYGYDDYECEKWRHIARNGA